MKFWDSVKLTYFFTKDIVKYREVLAAPTQNEIEGYGKLS